MILILSGDSDVSTDLVIDWLILKKTNFIRINSLDFLNKPYSIDIEKNTLKIGKNTIDLDTINIVWYRKFGNYQTFKDFEYQKKIMTFESLELIQKEFYQTISFVLQVLRKKKWITNPFNEAGNKPFVLLKAKEAGLDISTTYLTNSKEFLGKIKDQVIVKTIKDQITIQDKKTKKWIHGMFTNEVIDFEGLPDLFMPSYLQKKIDKEYELRIFYINKKIFTSVIFSQADEQTSLDFRKYNRDKPNRYLPYNLPEKIKRSIVKFMESIDLNCGSIDFIKGIDGNYYFLEVNIVGQFGMIDFPCNFGLHELVADELILNNY